MSSLWAVRDGAYMYVHHPSGVGYCKSLDLAAALHVLVVRPQSVPPWLVTPPHTTTSMHTP
jgi:hypothetical protein